MTRRGRTTSAVVALAAALAALPAGPAPAQAPSFGGGLLPGMGEGRTYTPTLGITLQPRGSRIALRFDSSIRCGRQSYDVVGRAVAPFDGSTVRASRASVMRIAGGRVEYAWTLTATVAAANADGVVRVVGRRRLGRGPWRPCTAKPERPFQARTAAPGGAQSAPSPSSVYLGLSQIELVDDLLGPVIVRTSGDGRSVAARWTAVGRCGRGAREHLVNFTPVTPVAPDGSFARAERFTVRYTDALVRYRVRFAGRFTDQGAGGDLRLQARVYDRRGRRLRTRCDSGTRAWTASRAGAATQPGSAGAPPAPASSPGTSSSSTSPTTSSSSGSTELRRPTPGPWSLRVTSESPSYVGLGESYSYGSPQDQIFAYGEPRHLSFDIIPGDSAKDDWTAGFFAPEGQTLVAGRTYTDTATSSPQPGSAGMSMSAGSRACNDGIGSFTVDALSFDADGTLRTARVRFEFRCRSHEGPVNGTWDFQAA